MTIAICDDNKDFLVFLHDFLLDYYNGIHDDELTIQTFLPDAFDFHLDSSGCSFDIVLMDIIMEQYNGIELVKKINKLNPGSIIIYISNYIEQTLNAYETSHIYFVLKSELETLLPRALKKAHAYLENQKAITLVSLKGNNGVLHNIPASDIMFFEVFGHQVTAHTHQEIDFQCSTPLKKLSNSLPEGFVRIHNSFLINMQYVRTFDSSKVILTNGNELPISRTYKKEFQNTYTQYITRFL